MTVDEHNLQLPPCDPITDGDGYAGFDPAASVPSLTTDQLALLGRVGAHWRRIVLGGGSWQRALPIKGDLVAAATQSAGRFTPVAFSHGAEAGEVSATAEALNPDSLVGRALRHARRVAIGHPLRSAAVAQERMRKLIALPVLASDALSSVAYGPQAMITVLALAGSVELGVAIPIAVAIGVLMLAVGLSYRQTVRAYPGGGGSYIVASDNLGELPGLFAAAGLMIDYVLTVAVSVAAGVAAVTSAIPSLQPDVIPIGLAVIVVLLVGNLRGVREAGAIFAWPTYAFILGLGLVITVGLVDAAHRGFAATPTPIIRSAAPLGVLLILRAFASGATAMTGIEAISNAIPAFKPPAWHNARTTLSWMIGLLIVMFAGVVALTRLDGIAPAANQTVLSQLAHRSLGDGAAYGYMQAATALVLLLAANTAFNDFPRLLYFMARDARAPSVFLRMGDRLAFSNGIIALALIAAVTFVALHGNTEALIPLYAVGVFLAFTLSQLGMVVHWWRRHGEHWRKSIVFNAVGCGMSAIVLVISAVTKFTSGAWVVVLMAPLLVIMFKRIRGYYDMVNAALALEPIADSEHIGSTSVLLGPDPAFGLTKGAAIPDGMGVDHRRVVNDSGELEESPEQIHHLAVVPVVSLDRASMRTLAYAASLGQPVLAVHISPNASEAKRFENYWRSWGDCLPLEVVLSPYRAIVVPLVRYLEALHQQRPDITLTVVLPELIPRHSWQRLLHGGIARRLRSDLRHHRRIVVTTVPFHLPG